MATKDPRIDAYIRKAAPFARPILQQLRAAVHEACPPVEETLKWGHPAFMYHGILGMMAAFKGHCSFGFWKGGRIVSEASDDAMGQFGRLTSVGDLPPKKKFSGYVKKAMELNENRVRTPRPKASPRAIDVPAELAAALRKNAAARAGFERLSPSHRREYATWVADAKRDETRARRIATAIEWIAEGKPKEWKYMKT